MTSPPPNVFDSGGSANFPSDEATASSRSHAPDAVAEIQSSCGIRESRPEGSVYPSHVPPDRPSPAANRLEEHSHRVKLEAGVAPGPQEAISLFELCIRGFDEAKFLFDIGCVPEDFEKYMALVDQLIEDDEPPLFLQRTG